MERAPYEELSKQELAGILKVHPGTLDRWAREGLYGVKLVPLYRGCMPRYTLAAYRAWQSLVNDARRPNPKPRVNRREKAREEARLEERLRRKGALR